ncbi:Hybrid signal transduction histidine kinase K [Paramyrothecium foliicola]|nr:Hybrid signal transduction histidine kinase K [Paramyrothecium foliicola]
MHCLACARGKFLEFSLSVATLFPATSSNPWHQHHERDIVRLSRAVHLGMLAKSPATDHLPTAKLLPEPSLIQFLDADPSPTFLIPIDTVNPIAFNFQLCNAALKAVYGLVGCINQDTTAALRFRSWAQAVVNWRETYDFAGRSWTAFSIQGRWKAVRVGKETKAASQPSEDSKPNAEDGSRKARVKDVSTVGTRLEGMQTMMEMSDVGVFEYHPHGTLIRANESWYRLSHHPREEDAHTDFSFMDLVYPDDKPLVMSQWNKLSQGVPVTFEMRWKAPRRNKNGEENEEEAQWVLSACVPIMDDENNLVSIAGNTIDINAQKSVQREALRRAEALERARASEQKFARFAELAPVAIYILKPDHGMQYCNQRFFELTGHPHVQPEQVDWSRLVFPEDQPIVEAGWNVLFKEKQPAQTQFRLQQKWDSGDGKARQVWAQGQAYPECDAEGNIVSILGTLTDITRFKWAEDIQRTRVDEALEAKRQQENFIDMTSHEMRNPLSAVIQCADSSVDALKHISKLTTTTALREASEDCLRKVQEEVRTCLEAVQTIVQCSLHQKRIIDDILTLSKLDSDLILITPVRVQPAVVVEEAVKIFEVECTKENIELNFLEDPSLAANGADWVMVDPSRTVQILINLLTNAIKFSRGRPLKKINVKLGAWTGTLPTEWNGITFATTRSTSHDILDNAEWGRGRKVYLWIAVQDTGCGLSVAEQGNLFTRFSQATPRTHVQYGGSGLGLFISKSLAELQSGCIGVHSQAGVGSTFAFFIGTRVATPHSTGETNGMARPGLPRSLSTEEAVKAAHYSVLIVEDNLVNQKVLCRQLQKAGFDVHVAGHGAEALEFLRTTKFWHTQALTGQDLAIILMDIEMPVMDGLTCTRRIRELEGSGEVVGHVPILAVSANARSEQVGQALDAGVDSSIAKPFRIPELLMKIELVVKK